MREWSVWDEHWDLKIKLYELIRQDDVSEMELRSYRGVCRFADERFENVFLPKHPHFSSTRRASELLNQILS